MPSVLFLADAPNVRAVDTSDIGRETRFGTTTVSPAIEPLSLRLPRDLLVLQPLQGHLDVEPVLLAPNLRCVIGSAEGCTVRLTKSTLVRPQHCTIEITGRQTILTHWVPETTWLNDRLVREPSELVPGDRIAIGPFDFQVRSASADELLYAKLVEHDPSDTNGVDDVLRLKKAIGGSKRDTITAPTESGHELALDLFSELLRKPSEDGSDSGTFEQLPQHITRLLSELQSQVCELQEREAELSQQLHSQYEPANLLGREVEPRADARDSAVPTLETSVVVAPAAVPAAVRPEYEQVLELLKSERDELDRIHEQVDQDRKNLAAEQEQWQEQKQKWTEQIEEVQAKFADLESQQQLVADEREVCRSLAQELMRDQTGLTEWEDRLRLEEQELARLRDEFNRRAQEVSTRLDDLALSETTIAESAPATLAAAAPLVPAPWIGPTQVPATFASPLQPSHPKQTLMTLIAFSLAALLLSGSFGDHEANTTIGWGTALIAAISTVDLLLRRCFSSSR